MKEAPATVDAVFAIRVRGEVVNTVSLQEGIQMLCAALQEAGGDQARARLLMLDVFEGLKRKV